MTAENPRAAFELIRGLDREINRELAEVDLTRVRDYEEVQLGMRARDYKDMPRVLRNLDFITDPHFILASDIGGFLKGDISSTHETLYNRWNKQRKAQGLPRIGSVVSGIGFTLKADPNIPYVRIDTDSRYWESLPEFAQALIDAGYTVVDAYGKWVAKEVDYTLFWAERNDI